MYIYKTNEYNQNELQEFLSEMTKICRFLGEDIPPHTVVKKQNGLVIIEIAEENDEILSLLSTCEKAMASVKMDQTIWAEAA